jgi:hypothetical protein
VSGPDRQYALSLIAFAAGAAAILGGMFLFVLRGGWIAAASLAGAAGALLYRFYRGARPDLPPPARKETP